MATKMQKKIEEIVSVLIKGGWERDRWGHFKKDVGGKVWRVKMQKTSMRLEKKLGSRWYNSVSDYFSKIDIYEDGLVIKGNKYKLGVK